MRTSIHFARQAGRRFEAIALLALVALSPGAYASGDFGPPVNRFVSERGEDIDPRRLEAGHFGVIQTGWPRLRLYAAWRAIRLDAVGLPGPALPAGALDRILGQGQQSDLDCTAQGCVSDWLKAANAVFADPKRANVTGMRMSPDYEDYVECPSDAFNMATRTLVSLSARPDATSERLRTWVEGQDAVFSNCDLPTPIPDAWKGDSFRMRVIDRAPTPRIPELLPRSEPEAWRQQREYQVAAALFHAGRAAEAASAFLAIAGQPGHAMHQWGGYLALRAGLRQAIEVHQKDVNSAAAAQALAQLQRQGDTLLADPSLRALHEATRATLRRAQARLTPQAYFLGLSRTLQDPALEPMADDRLGDWRVLSFKVLDGGDDDLAAKLRTASPMIDWMSTIQACATSPDLPIIGAGRPSAKDLLTLEPTSPDALQVGRACKSASLHALDRWHEAEAADRTADARPWMVAYLMTTDFLPQEIRAKALAVPARAPEYLTLQAQLARVARLVDDISAERAAAEAGLAVADASQDPQARNVFLRARFDTAPDVASAIADLERPVSAKDYLATGESQTIKQDESGIDQDGEAWLDTRLSAEDLVVVAASERLRPLSRIRIAVAAWLRADFTDQPAPAERAARLAGDLLARLKPLAESYLHSAPAVRHHLLLVGILQFELYPDVHRAWQSGEWFVQAQSPGDVLADQWCSIAGTGLPNVTAASNMPPSWRDIQNRPLRDAKLPEVAAAQIKHLRALPTATGMIGRDSIAWARQHPDDPAVPWLLHVTVQSTRGGCLDADAHALSASAHRLLQRRYPDNEWAKRTPYFF
jgi:hypothetical protein